MSDTNPKNGILNTKQKPNNTFKLHAIITNNLNIKSYVFKWAYAGSELACDDKVVVLDTYVAKGCCSLFQVLLGFSCIRQNSIPIV